MTRNTDDARYLRGPTAWWHLCVTRCTERNVPSSRTGHVCRPSGLRNMCCTHRIRRCAVTTRRIIERHRRRQRGTAPSGVRRCHAACDSVVTPRSNPGIDNARTLSSLILQVCAIQYIDAFGTVYLRLIDNCLQFCRHLKTFVYRNL